jgi:pimeloyl-ACP methyl ester carboxylesterase
MPARRAGRSVAGMSSISPDAPGRRRRVTSPRVVALVLVAVAGAFLVHLSVTRDAGRASVPAGARADQLVKLKPCRYAADGGRLAADCGTLVVRENRRDPRSRLIALPVTRIRARSAHPAEPIFRLEGGPGLTNMKFPYASRYIDRHDLVLVGYRGVDGSSRLDCPEVRDALRHSRDLLGRASLESYSSAFRRCADRLRAGGTDLRGYTMPQRVDDLDAARRALGYPRVDLLSESAGTRTAMVYAWRHPAAVRRSVMVGVNPPGHFVWDPRDTDALLHRYAELCAADAACQGRTPDLVGALRDVREHVPDRWGPLHIKPGNARLAAFYGLPNVTSAGGPLSGPTTLSAWQAAEHGDASGLWLGSLLADVVFPRAFVWGDVAAMGRMDVGAARRHFASDAGRGTVLGDAGNAFTWAGGRLADAWPSTPDDDAYAHVPTSRVQTLLIGGSLDGTTPPRSATRDLLPHLPNGHQVILADFGHTDDFWQTQPAAGTRLITTYLDSGKVDTSRYRPLRVDLSPATTQQGLAKMVAGSLVALAVITLLALVLLPRRVRRRGRLGRKAAVAVRTVGALLIGLGGWCAAALFVLVALPTVPIDAEGLAVASIATPIALATYWAWVRRDLAAPAKAAGLAAAAAGAIVGAWLGFSAAEAPMALITAILGACAGANFALTACDIAAEPLAGPPAAQDAPADAAEPVAV